MERTDIVNIDYGAGGPTARWSVREEPRVPEQPVAGDRVPSEQRPPAARRRPGLPGAGRPGRAALVRRRVLHALVWWPPLSLLCLAAWPNAGVSTVAGLGVGLALVGLVDTLNDERPG